MLEFSIRRLPKFAGSHVVMGPVVLYKANHRSPSVEDRARVLRRRQLKMGIVLWACAVLALMTVALIQQTPWYALRAHLRIAQEWGGIVDRPLSAARKLLRSAVGY